MMVVIIVNFRAHQIAFFVFLELANNVNNPIFLYKIGAYLINRLEKTLLNKYKQIFLKIGLIILKKMTFNLKTFLNNQKLDFSTIGLIILKKMTFNVIKTLLKNYKLDFSINGLIILKKAEFNVKTLLNNQKLVFSTIGLYNFKKVTFNLKTLLNNQKLNFSTIGIIFLKQLAFIANPTINNNQYQNNINSTEKISPTLLYNLLQNNYYGLDIVSSFSFCYFSDFQIIYYFQQDSQTECKEDYKFSPNKRQCTQSCNCQDLVSLQNNKCYNCMQNCSLECLMCIQEKCYACLEGWQLVDSKCQQICGDNQVALYSNEQCDDGNQIIEDGCHECQFQCGLFCQFCDKDINCLICDLNFQLINNICQPICGDKIVISGLEECDDGNDIQYDGCFECQFQCSFDCKVCESGKCQDKCKAEEEFLNGQCITKVQTLNQTKDNEPESQQQQELKIVCKNNCLVCDGDLCLECQPDYILEYNKCLSCGNGIINQDEECDDGNRINSDGCSKQCKIEDNWNCIGSFSFISQCFPISKISVLFLNSTLNTQYVKLSYTKEVKLDQQNINFLDFNLNQINIDPTYYIVYYFAVLVFYLYPQLNVYFSFPLTLKKEQTFHIQLQYQYFSCIQLN